MKLIILCFIGLICLFELSCAQIVINTGNWTSLQINPSNFAGNTTWPPAVQSPSVWKANSIGGSRSCLFGGYKGTYTINLDGTKVSADFFCFNLTTGAWTRVGTGTTSAIVTPGAFDPSNYPGRLMGAASWTDSQGRLWLFGGFGDNIAASPAYGSSADLWLYDFQLGHWAWVNGPRVANAVDVITGCPSSTPSECWPGSRLNAHVWQISPQDVYLTGGLRIVDNIVDTFSGADLDMWHLNLTSGVWTYIPKAGPIGFSIEEGCPLWAPQTHPDKLILYGGYLRNTSSTRQGAQDTIWIWDLVLREWRLVVNPDTTTAKLGTFRQEGPPSTTWPSRRSNCGALELSDDGSLMWLYGGFTCGYISDTTNCQTGIGSGEIVSGETWVLNLTSWQFRLQDDGSLRPQASWAGISWKSGDLIYFFAGVVPINSAVAADLWVYNTSNVLLLPTNAPIAAPTAAAPIAAPTAAAPITAPMDVPVTAPVSPPVSIPVSAPVSSGCVGSAPTGFVCVNGIWTLDRQTVQIVGAINGSVAIINTTLNLNAGENSTLFVTGNVSVSATIFVVSLTPQQIGIIKGGSTLTTTVIVSTGDIATEGVIVQTNDPSVTGRVVVTIDPTTGQRTLSVLFTFQDPNGAAAGVNVVPIAAGVGATVGVVIIAIVIAIILRKTKFKYVGATVRTSRIPSIPQAAD